MNKRISPPTRVGDQDRLPPVRVKLLRRDAYAEQTAPPDGEGEEWWSRLNKALGTVSTDFVRASLLQVQGAARSPFGTISETAINAALAMIEAVDREFDKLAAAFIGEIVDVLRERLLVRDPTQVVFKSDEAVFLGQQLEMLLLETIGFKEPVRAWLSLIEGGQCITADPTLSRLEFFVERLVFLLTLLAVALVNAPPFLWREAGQIFRVR